MPIENFLQGEYPKLPAHIIKDFRRKEKERMEREERERPRIYAPEPGHPVEEREEDYDVPERGYIEIDYSL